MKAFVIYDELNEEIIAVYANEKDCILKVKELNDARDIKSPTAMSGGTEYTYEEFYIIL